MLAYFFSAMAGAFGVLQAGFNKTVADSWGFSASLLLNGSVFLIFNALLFAVVWWTPKTFPQEYLIQGSWSDFRLWWIIPGIMGFLLVMGLAVAIGQIGALQTMVISIAAQIVCGVLWDLAIENRPMTVMRITGASITLVGAVLATR